MFVKKRNPFIKNQKAEFLSLNVRRRREDEEKFSQFFVFFYFFILKGKLLKLEIQRVTYIKDEAEFDVPILSILDLTDNSHYQHTNCVFQRIPGKTMNCYFSTRFSITSN